MEQNNSQSNETSNIKNTIQDLSTSISFNRKKIHNAGCINTFWLKIIAIVCMTIDHVGACLGIIYVNQQYYLSGLMDMNTYSILRIIGRLAFPIFCYLIVEGLFYTRDVMNYIIRLLIFALISQIPFSLMTRKAPFAFDKNLNVYFTLALGLITIALIDYFKERSNKKDIPTPIFLLLSAVAIICSTSFADTINTDYAGYGVWVIVIFYAFRDKPLLISIGLLIATLLMSNTTELYALIAMIPIVMHNHQKGFSMKYVFYAYYPVHMLALYFVWLALS